MHHMNNVNNSVDLRGAASRFNSNETGEEHEEDSEYSNETGRYGHGKK